MRGNGLHSDLVLDVFLLSLKRVTLKASKEANCFFKGPFMKVDVYVSAFMKAERFLFVYVCVSVSFFNRDSNRFIDFLLRVKVCERSQFVNHNSSI